VTSASTTPPLVIDTHSETETDHWGGQLAQALEPGLVVALMGNLGAGKTRLVKAVARGGGIEPGDVTSPTFVLVQEYEGIWPLYHFDTYRLANPAGFADLGIDEYFAGEGVCLVEWADRVAPLLPPDHLRIEIETTGTHSRRFLVQSLGPRSDRVLQRLRQAQRLRESLGSDPGAPGSNPAS
jgi:tRNA threonylcarbamoyladenosine biosynthesis protein TsaE